MGSLSVFVDESGQDASSQSFIVVAVVSRDDLDALREALLTMERTTGIGFRKWHKAQPLRRRAFLRKVVEHKLASGRVYVGVYQKPLPYFLPLLDTVEKAIRGSTPAAGAASVYVDGIDRKKARELTNALRVGGVRVRLVQSRRDESEPLIRLADRWAGCVRTARRGHAEEHGLLRRAVTAGYLHEVSDNEEHPG
jgi:uncharacterized protein DUF3800